MRLVKGKLLFAVAMVALLLTVATGYMWVSRWLAAPWPPTMAFRSAQEGKVVWKSLSLKRTA